MTFIVMIIFKYIVFNVGEVCEKTGSKFNFRRSA